jgi:hypothetical protein
MHNAYAWSKLSQLSGSKDGVWSLRYRLFRHISRLREVSMLQLASSKSTLLRYLGMLPQCHIHVLPFRELDFFKGRFC